MKKLIIIAITLFFLTGCTLFEEVNNTTDYVNEATDYIQTLSEFGNEVPELIQATSNLEVNEQLNTYIDNLKTEITTFINIEPPQIAKDVHKQLVTSGEEILTVINNAVDNGEVMVNQIENSDIFQTIRNVSNLMNVIESLGL